mmetsp:Transcript_45381/g.45809  ORF Transcript_45381/g.45809 Transcript_45381/m.45809 type:complete len:103 (+) Transcript_45381:699-1007(+)
MVQFPNVASLPQQVNNPPPLFNDAKEHVNNLKQPQKHKKKSTVNTSKSNSQSLLLVKVPPGTNPGSTIHVQTPDNETIAAVVPPGGVNEFHVSYYPQQNPSK